MSLLFKLLGWKFAEEGDKADTFCREFGALGIRIILDEADKGLVKFTNTEKRSAELIGTINTFLSKGSMTSSGGAGAQGTNAIHGWSVVWTFGKIMYERGHQSCM